MSNYSSLLPVCFFSLGLTLLAPQDEVVSVATTYVEGQVLETQSVIEFTSELTAFSIVRDGEEIDMGDRMGRHADGSLLPLHFCGRFGDAVGAELCIGDARYANGVFLL